MNAVVFGVLSLIWGSTWLAIKIGLADVSPQIALVGRFALSLTILFSLVRIKKLSLPIRLIDWWRIGFPGLLMYGTSYNLVYLAEMRITSALTAVLFGSFPLFVAICSAFLLPGERLSLKAWLGMLVGLAGVVIISRDSLATSEFEFTGTVMAITAAAASALGIVLHKRYHGGGNIFVNLTVQLTLGAIVTVILALLLEPFDAVRLTGSAIASVVYLAVMGTVVAFLLYYWLVARSRAVFASLIAFVTPVVAIFFGVVIYGEPYTLPELCGTAMILSGVVLIVRR